MPHLLARLSPQSRRSISCHDLAMRGDDASAARDCLARRISASGGHFSMMLMRSLKPDRSTGYFHAVVVLAAATLRRFIEHAHEIFPLCRLSPASAMRTPISVAGRLRASGPSAMMMIARDAITNDITTRFIGFVSFEGSMRAFTLPQGFS